MVSPSTGNLRYALPPDVAPRVPYGGGIGFRRFYLSLYAPGGAAPAYRKALGERWGHTYATWIDDVSAGGTTKIVLHMTRGQDVLLTKTSSDATWEYFTPQPGFHYKHVRRRLASPHDYEVTLLTGETLAYSGGGRLSEIRTPKPSSSLGDNVVALTYDGNDQLSTVTDASQTRRLLFSYTSGLMTSVEFQILVLGAWTTYHTTTYGYTSGYLTTVSMGSSTSRPTATPATT